MSSHREAPEIAKDPVADTTDTYAFMHPTKKNYVVLICNFIPLQQPNGGPNFYEFSDEVLYRINVSNTNKCVADITFDFRFTTTVPNKDTFLYNTGPINSINDDTWNRPQTYTVTRTQIGKSDKVIASGLKTAPVNVGPRSTPDYGSLSKEATYDAGNIRIFAGQRADAFHVDLGSIFDLGGLRPLNSAHLLPMAAMDGVNAVQGYNVHTIALQMPARMLTQDGQDPAGPRTRQSVIGVWASASRQSGKVFDAGQGKFVPKGPFVQVSRLGNPLFNEAINPMSVKDKWNTTAPNYDSAYAKYVNQPELGKLLPVLYPGAFPNLAAYTKDRADLHAILLTGLPNMVIKNADGTSAFTTYTGPVEADMLRLNMAVPPTPPAQQKKNGLLAGQLDGYPNGRRLIDDIVAIELQAIAGATIPLVDPSYTPDAAVAAVDDGTTTADNATPSSFTFPFLNLPGGGYETMPGTTTANQPGSAKAGAKPGAKAGAKN